MKFKEDLVEWSLGKSKYITSNICNINWLRLSKIWRIMQIEEGIIKAEGQGRRWITASSSNLNAIRF